VFLDAWQPLIYAISRDPFARLRTGDNVEKIPVTVFGSNQCPSVDADLVIIFVKSSSTESAMKALLSKQVISSHTVILTLQGGLDNPDIIASRMDNHQLLLTGSTNSSCKTVGTMIIENFVIETTTVWPYHLAKDAMPVPRVQEIVKLCDEAGLKMKLTPQAISDRWKMLLRYPTNTAISAICGLTYGTVWETEYGRNLLLELAKEVALVARLEGIDETLFNENIAVEAITELAQAEPDSPGTMLLDYKAKRITEIDATAGALVRKAEQHGVALPMTYVVWSILRLKEENYGNEYV
jgi:2-dehydropantoate 2-reductase